MSKDSMVLGQRGWKQSAAALFAVIALGLSAIPAAHAESNDADEGSLIVVSSRDAEYAPEISVSYVPSWNSKDILNDGVSDIGNNNGQVWATWGGTQSAENGAHWATYSWEVPVVVESSSIWFWQNAAPLGDSGVLVPESWKLQYQASSDEWVDIEADYPTPTRVENSYVSGPYEVSFTPVKTRAVRVLVKMQNGDKAIGATEWQVKGQYDIAPPNPNEPVSVEDVHLRTLSGGNVRLPAQVWAIPENGPLTYYDVTWEGLAGSTVNNSVGGVIEANGARVTANINVVDDLESPLEFVEYAATITTPGVAPVCPQTVVGEYSDGSLSSQVAVKWESPAAEEYSEAETLVDIPGTVEGYERSVLCTAFVVDPTASENPVVRIDTARPSDSGWYTEAPEVTVVAEEGASELARVEYRIDEGEWAPYETPFVIGSQGTVKVSARVTDIDGRESSVTTELKIDTEPPVTEARVIPNADNTRVTVELISDDGELGSGVTRILWASSEDGVTPTTMWATYDEINVPRGAEDSYVLFYAQDAAGLAEAQRSVKIDKRAADPKPQPQVPATVVHRYGGLDRYATSNAINEEFMKKDKPVFVASGRDYADALTAAPAVASVDGSLVLTDGKKLDSAVISQLKAITSGDVYLIGGPDAVTVEVEKQVKKVVGSGNVIRLGGADRYRTSLNVSRYFFPEVTLAYVATGRDYADALSAAAVAGKLKAPVVLVDGRASSVPTTTTALLKESGVENVVIVGGPDAISDDVVRYLARGFSVERVGGMDRYGTNSSLNEDLGRLEGNEESSVTDVWVATGNDFPDALAAAAQAGKGNQRLYLSDGRCLPVDAVSLLGSTGDMSERHVRLVGGQSALSAALDDLKACAK